MSQCTRIKERVIIASKEVKTAQTEGCSNFTASYLNILIREYIHNNMSHLELRKWSAWLIFKMVSSAALFMQFICSFGFPFIDKCWYSCYFLTHRHGMHMLVASQLYSLWFVQVQLFDPDAADARRQHSRLSSSQVLWHWLGMSQP